MITIRHTHEDGTLLEGTVKGDGVYDIARKHGFRYFPSIKMIGIGQSRDHIAKRWLINGAAEALRRAGFEVEVVIDDVPRDRAQVLAGLAVRLDDRKDALEAKAARHAGHAEAAYERSNAIAARFEGGQPILVGHHSEKRARADQAKIHAAMGTFVAETKVAEEVASRASVVGKEAARRERPDVTQRRIKKAEADLRGIDRSLDGYQRTFNDHSGVAYYVERHAPATGEHRESLLARKAQLEDQLAYDRQLLADSGATIWGKDNLHVGDLVRSNWSGWREIAKVNRTTVGLRSQYSWLDKCAFTDIRQVRCVHEALSDVDDAENMPENMPDEAPTCGNAYPITSTPANDPGRSDLGGTSAGGSAPETAPAPAVDFADALAKMKAVAAQVDRTATALKPDPQAAFYATPASLAAQIIREHTDLHDIAGAGTWVLEPSAGTGSLVDAIRAANRDVEIVAVEPNQLRADMIRSAARHMVTFEEFAGYWRTHLFDLVVMNPPFAVPGNPTIWIDHIQLAWQLLAPGGRLVAIAPNGYVFRDDTKHRAMRELVGEFGGHQELPDDAFAESGTKMRTVVLWADKPADAPEPEDLSTFAGILQVDGVTVAKIHRTTLEPPLHECEPSRIQTRSDGAITVLCPAGHVVTAVAQADWAGSQWEAKIGAMQAARRAAEPQLSREQVSIVAHAKDGLKCVCRHLRQSHGTEEGRGLGSGECHLCDCGRFALGPIEHEPVCHGDPAHGRMRQAPPQWCGSWWECTWPTCTRKVLMPSESLLQILGWTPAVEPSVSMDLVGSSDQGQTAPIRPQQLSLLDLLNV